MSQHDFQVTYDSAMSVDQLFARLADHNQMGKVLGAPIKRIVDGDKDVNGVGSVRKIGLGPLTVLEETVTSFVPGKSIEYTISRGPKAILHSHKGSLTFTRTGKGSQVVWRIRFEAPIALVGTLLEKGLGRALALGLKRLG